MKKIFKIIGMIVGSLIGLILLIVLYYTIQNKVEKNKIDNVKISITYDGVSCSKKYPLSIWIFNGTKKTILSTSFDIGVYENGYSSNISGYPTVYISTDKIIPPSGGHSFCAVMPELTRDIEDINTLSYEALFKYINFKD